MLIDAEPLQDPQLIEGLITDKVAAATKDLQKQVASLKKTLSKKESRDHSGAKKKKSGKDQGKGRAVVRFKDTDDSNRNPPKHRRHQNKLSTPSGNRRRSSNTRSSTPSGSSLRSSSTRSTISSMTANTN